MADNRSIIITLKVDDSGVGETDISNQVDTSKKEASTNSDHSAKAAAKALAIQAVGIAANEATAWAEYYWNRELTLNDDYVGQRSKQIALTQINRGISLVSTIGSSTAAGAAFGPAGAIIGAVLGTVTAIAGIARSNIQGQDQQNIMLRQINAGLDFTRSRAGWSTTAASIGEDL